MSTIAKKVVLRHSTEREMECVKNETPRLQRFFKADVITTMRQEGLPPDDEEEVKKLQAYILNTTGIDILSG